MQAEKDQTISQEQADFHLHLLRRIADNLLDRYAYFTLWMIRQWNYAGLSGDHFHWPYAGAVNEISFVEELVWVLHEEGHEIFEDAYSARVVLACRSAVERLTNAEEEVLLEVVPWEMNQKMTCFQRRDIVQDALCQRTMNIARNSDMEGIRESWAAYGWAFEALEDEED